jgi:hypothetical protein
MTADIIKGPWKKSRKVVVPDTDEVAALQETMLFCDELTETLMVQMIHAMGENGIDVTKDTFIQSMGFTIESVKATIFREMGLRHPLSMLMDKVTELKASEESYSELNSEKLELILKLIDESHEPEPEIS